VREADSRDSGHLELGHVYERLKKLEDGQTIVQQTLQAVQLKLAEGPRFPTWLPASMVAIILFLAGQTGTAVWWASGTDSRVSSMPDMHARLTSAFNGMRSCEAATSTVQSEHVRMRDMIHRIDESCCKEIPVMLERLKALDERVAGRGEKGWNRDDHNLYAETVKARLDGLEQRLYAQEQRSQARDSWWDELKSKGTLK